MGLSDIAGVFSRYFIVGFFLPAFFVLLALAQCVDGAFLPQVYVHASSGARVAIIGGAGLAVGLLLLGLNYNVVRLYEGYPLEATGSIPLVKIVYRTLLHAQRLRFRRGRRKCESHRLDDQGRFNALWRLGLRFPYDRENLDSTAMLLPTAFGNAIRAFEARSFVNWHLNSIGAWPHIENLLSEQEAQVLADSKGDVAFFLNSSLLSIASAVVLAVDLLEHHGAGSLLFLAIPVAVAFVAYAAAIGAAERWGSVVCACIDLHRLELYAKLGVRAPIDFTQERLIAWNLNSTLLLGGHVPDALAAGSDANPTDTLGSSPPKHQGKSQAEPERGPHRKLVGLLAAWLVVKKLVRRPSSRDLGS